MTAVKAMVEEGLSLSQSLELSGCSRKAYYYVPRERSAGIDQAMVENVKGVIGKRPFYGTRRVAAVLSRDLGEPVNRKQIQRIFGILGWSEPSKTKTEIIRSAHPLAMPSMPNELWAGDLTYVWCGADGWGYLFNVIDVYTRRWLGYVFSPSAVKENAIASVQNALLAERPETPPRIRTDRGPQYTSNAFKGSMEAFGMVQEMIARNTPEQNGHIESFP